MSQLLESGILQQSRNAGEAPPTEPAYWGVNITIPNDGDSFTVYLSDTGGTANIDVDWGDGSAAENLSTVGAGLIHDYTTAGNYLVKLSGSGSLLVFEFDSDDINYGTSYPERVTGTEVIGGITGISSFLATFRNCVNLTSLPANLFRFCGAVGNFNSTFLGCTGLTSLPFGLFRYNSVTTGYEAYFFYRTFYQCSGLLTLPASLFRYLTTVGVYGYKETFAYCSSLQMRDDLWGSNMQAHFDGRTVGFENFLLRAPNANANGGIAPALWDLTNVTFTGTDAFGGTDSATTLSNYADIPAGWL